MKKIRFFLLLIVSMLSVNLLFAEMRSSITQYGVTWNFDGQYECGQFITGDWWVVGPVTITSASPMPSSGRNGSCVNPMPGRQGYDDRQSASYTYSTADRISYPYTLQPDQSLVTGVSKPESETALQNYGVMESQAVLTAVSAAQPANAFRPAYSGTYKRYFTTSQLNMGLIPNVAPPASKPDAANIANYIDLPRIDHINNWTMQWGCSEQNWSNGPEADNDYPCYGRGYSKIISQAALYSMLAVTDKDDIIYSLIQIGIDNYGILKAGGQWSADGGHMNGRKFPMVFAAKLLNDADMLQVGTQYAQKTGPDMQTYYGTNGTALWGKNCTSPTYFLNGCSGGGAKDCRDPEGLVDGCPDYRDNQTSRTWPGHALAALMMDAKSVWNHNAFFDYVDRWMDGGVSGGGGTGNTFVSDMWNLYRDNLPGGGGTIVDVTGVSVSPASLTLEEGASADLTETVLPDSATYKTVTWGSSNTSIATVDANGLVTAVAEGSCTVTVTTTDGGYTDNCSVTVNSVGTNVALNQSITVSAYQDDTGGTYPGTNLIDGDVSDAARWSASGFPQWAEIDLGASYDLGRIDVFPYQDRPYQYTIEASTDGTNYSTIVDRSANTESGDVLIDAVSTTARYLKIMVTGVSGGISSWVSLAELKAYSGSFTPISVTGVSVSPTSLTLDPGTSSDLTETVSPSNATNKAVSWTSANTSIATVNAAGLVSAIAQGNTTITVTTVDGGYTATCNVTVNAPPSGLMNLPGNNNRFTITDITWPANVGDAEVCLWNDDKVAAVSINIDDNKEADHPWWMSMAAQYPIFTFTWFINSGNGNANWSAWQAIINAGHEVQAHDNILAGDPYMLSLTGDGEVHHCDINLAEDQFYHDTYSDYNDIIETQLGNQVSTMAYPCGTVRVDAIDDVYIACRGVYGVMNTANGINYLNINSRSAVNNVHDVQVLLDPNETLYNNVYYRGLSSNHYHGVDTDTKKQETEAFLAAIYAERDKLWAGGFSEIARYGQERDSHTLTVTNVSSDEISFNLTDQMIDTYFDFPLTVKIRINNSWTDITAIQGGSVIESSIVTYNGNKYAFVKAVPDRGLVTVSAGSVSIVNVTGVSVSPTTLSLNAGQTSDLTETVSPANATDKSVTWSSNNTSVATVNSSGLVTAVSAGSATITVTTNDGGFTANCAVTVNTAPPAGIYYCDPVSGSMSNDGSQSSPWSTLEAVFAAGKTFVAGDILYLRNGYHGYPVITGNNSGYVTITAEAGQNPGVKKLNVSNASNWIISGLTVSPELVGSYERGDFINIESTSNNITVENCYVYSTTSISGWSSSDVASRFGNGIKVSGPNCLVTNNLFKQTNFTIAVSKTSTGTDVTYNTIEGFMSDGMRGLASNCKFEYNVVKTCYGIDTNHDDGFQCWTTDANGTVGAGVVSNVEIRGNMFINQLDASQPFPPDTYGMQGIGNFDGFFENWVIENNLVVTDMWHGISFYGATNCKIVNNTVVKNSIDILGYTPWIGVYNHKNGTASSGNIMYNNLTSNISSSLGTTTSNNIVTQSYTSHFVDYAGFDFRLQPTSSAIDGGTTSSAPVIDLNQYSRSGNPDVGCYELGTSSTGGDSIAPSVPTGLTVGAITASSVALSWNASTDDVGVAGYMVYINGSNPVTSSGTSAVISSLAGSTTYTFTVGAYDASGNQSAQSSSVNATTLAQTGITSDATFQSFILSTQTGAFTAEYDAIPNGANIDAVTGIQNGVASAYGDMACIMRFNSSGQIDARNGGSYTATNTVNYTAGVSYHFRVEVDVPSHIYSVYVTPQGGSEQTVASDFAFRSEQASVAQLTGWSLYANSGSHTVDNMTFTISGTIPVTGVSVSPTTLTLDEGQTSDLTETVSPANAINQSVTWSSNNTSVATVDANGLVTAVSAGNATITVTTVDGGYTATCGVTVNVSVVPVTGVSVSPTTLTLDEGQTSDLTETVSPANATDQSVTWGSNNTSVATVDANGLVTAVSAGSATITVTTNDGSFTAISDITVNEPVSNRTETIISSTDDMEIRSNGGSQWVGYASHRVGGAGSGYDGCSVHPFQLPALNTGETVLSANFSIYLNSISNSPAGNVDLYGIAYRSASSVNITGDYWQGSFGADPNATAIDDDFATTSTAEAAFVMTDASGSSNLADYINAQYAAGAQAGDYIFIRLNPDVADVGNYSYWTFASANDGTNKPMLELEIGGGAPSVISVTGVALSSTTLALDEGQTSQLTETVSPANATDQSVTWSSNNTSVATVGANGLVTAVSAGSATIAVTTNDGGYTATCGVTVNVPVIPVTGVSVSPTTLTLDEGQTSQLSETVSPANATDQSVTWNSDNTSIATVDANGLVTAVSAGSATITVTTNDGSFIVTCAVTVNVPVIPVVGVDVSPTSITLEEGECVDLTETVSPANATDKSVTWSSDNTSVVVVDANGLVCAVSAGNATITVTTVDGSYTATSLVTVIVPVTGVTLSSTSITLEEGQTDDLDETVLPANATNKNVTWSSSNASVATVDASGLVTAIAEGLATITVTTIDGGFTATCDVTVNEASTNLALNKPITVSAYQDDAYGYKPGENLVDGDVSDDARWSASGFPQWAEIDLGANYDLNQIDLYPYQDRAYQYIVEAKTDGGSYTTIIDKSANTESADLLVSPVSVTARYVKITVSGLYGSASTWVSLSELSVWGTTPATVPVTGVSLSASTLNLDAGQTSDLDETVSPVDATDKSVTWSSNNSSVATVDANGLVTAVSSGTAAITVTTNDGGFTANCSVTVTVPVTGVSLSATMLNLDAGQTSDLDETVSPTGATDKTVTWSSNNTSVATVDANGLVTAVSAGSATITVTTNDGGFTANCSVTVTVPVTGVTLSLSALNLVEGQTSDLDETVSPANATDKSVAWSSNNTSIATVDANGLVTAVLAGSATITVTTNDGSFTANCSVTVTEPQIQTLTVAASTDDQEIRSNGGSQWYAYATHRIGGAGSGYDACVVTPFALPALNTGETVLSANFSVYLNSIANNPGCNIDLYGLPYRATSSVNVTGDYYQGSFGGDAGSTAVQDDFATTSTAEGAYVTTSVSGAQDLAAYINAQYAAGAQAGDYIFIRMNPDIADVGNYAYWTFQSANGTEKPTLELEIGSSSSATISSLSDNDVEFDVYPNPVSTDNVTIELTGYDVNNNTILSIMDITGKQVRLERLILNEVNTKIQLNVNSMNKGIYFITVTNGDYTTQTKLIVQ